MKVCTIIYLIANILFGLTGCGGGSNAPNNQTTKAVAGLPQNVVSGSVVALDGSQSTGAAGSLITYQWSIISKPVGSTTELINSIDVNPTFTVDKPGEYTLRLAVSDALSTSISDVIISAAGPGLSAPMAHAGIGQSVLTGTFVTLDGSASSDANGDLLTYRWSLQSVPTGSSAILSSDVAARPTFIADLEGVYVLSLTVNNGKVNSSAAAVTVTASGDDHNVPPVANAGTAQSVIRGALVTLDGSATDASGVTLKYSWSFTSKPAGSMAVLSSATVAKPTFRADVSGAYVLNLVVSNDESNSRAATVTISASAANAKPVAYAGFNRSVETGKPVMLDGSRSSDANGDVLTYNWAFISRPGSVILSNTTAQKPTFTASLSGDYVVELIVNDGIVDSTPVRVTITAAPLDATPVAYPSSLTSTPVVGEKVYLDGHLSHDADGSLLTYEWTLTPPTGSTTAALSSRTTINPFFTPDIAGVYQATLIARSATTSSAPVTITITAVAPYIELSWVGYYGDDILSLPYNQTDISTPAVVSGVATVATFKLATFGTNYTVSNLSVTSSSVAVTPSFVGLANGQVITTGNYSIFYLVSNSTGSDHVNVSYRFTITEEGASAGKMFTYSTLLTTN